METWEESRRLLLTQHVGSVVHVSDQVVARGGQLGEQRVGVAVEREVLYAAFCWRAE